MTLDPGSIAFLEAEGFEGFRTVGQLHADRCEEVPNSTGVYVLVRESIEPPELLPFSTAPTFRGVDPSRPVAELRERWVPGAQVLYIGIAPGPGVRNLLKQRVKRYLRFGHGRVVSHWGGRFVWQLADATTLRIAWKPTEDDPSPLEARLLDPFRRHYGRLPYANLRGEAEP